jgi:Putative prokaryotic signal transducing protein
MKCVYEASSGLDGHMILNLLKQVGITGRIDGEYLQGGIGELQAMNFVRVLVSEQDYAEARKIINEWESIQPEPDNPAPEAETSGGLQIFVIGMIVGAVIMYWLLKSSIS